MLLGFAADHGAFDLKQELIEELRCLGHKVTDFGAYSLDPDDDFPDFVTPLARAVASREVERGIALSENTIGASVCANKIPRVRAGMPFDHVSTWQGVEDSHMNVICLDTRILGRSIVWDLLQTFLAAKFSDAEKNRRRLGKIANLEMPEAHVRRV
jgi:ribose 5-phosphate isomerase B